MQNQYRYVGKITEITNERGKIDGIPFLMSIKYTIESGETRGLAITKETEVYRQLDNGHREKIDKEQLSKNDKIEIWLFFANEHLVAAKQITVLIRNENN